MKQDQRDKYLITRFRYCAMRVWLKMYKNKQQKNQLLLGRPNGCYHREFAITSQLSKNRLYFLSRRLSANGVPDETERTVNNNKLIFLRNLLDVLISANHCDYAYRSPIVTSSRPEITKTERIPLSIHKNSAYTRYHITIVTP